MTFDAEMEHKELRRLRFAVNRAIELLDDMEATGLVDEWEEPMQAGFYMTRGLLNGD